MRIWKWDLEATDQQTLKMPEGTEILSVQTQKDEPKLWGLCDPKAPLEKRHFAIYGTGNPLPDFDIGKFIGTFQIRGESLVFHVFENT